MALEELKQSLRYRWTGEFSTPLGRRWRPRIEASEADFRKNSADWDYLRNLFAHMVTLEEKSWSTSVAMAYSILTNSASDTYFNNPESWIQAKSGDPTGDVSKAFRDITNTIHRDADTEGIMRKCLICDGFAGFGVHWSYFEQVDAVPAAAEPREMIDPAAPPVLPPPPETVSQKVCGDFCEPWDFRIDPGARDWKLKDAKYIIRKYRKSVADLIALPFGTEDGRAMLYTWGMSRRQSRDHASDSQWGSDHAGADNDPGHVDVDMWEIWDRVSKMVIHIPVGADFDLGSYAWPRAWRYADTFPATFVAFNWEPGDRQRTRGFWPIPLLRLIAEQLENINRLEGLYMEAATAAVIKYLTVAGLIEGDALTNLTSDRSRIVVAIDITKIREFFPAAVNNIGEIDLKKIFHQLEAEDKSKAFDFERAIEHELRQISRIVGAGAQDRYGLPESKSATEAAGLIDAMQKRGRTKSELAANKYDEVTEKFWLILKTMQTLPIEYLATTPDLTEGVWRQWTDLSKVRTMNLAFSHRAGSSRARDPQQEAVARNAAAQMLLPIYQAAQQFDKVDTIARWMLEPQNFRDLDVFRSQSKELAMELAYLTTLLAQNPALAADPDFADRKADLASQLALSLLSPAETQQVAARVQKAMETGEAMSPGGGVTGSKDPRGRKTEFEHVTGSSPGSLSRQDTAGESAYAGEVTPFAGSAAAGRSNVG